MEKVDRNNFNKKTNQTESIVMDTNTELPNTYEIKDYIIELKKELDAAEVLIQEKKKNIKSLHQKLMNNMRNPSYILSVDERAVNMHQKKMNRKIDFLRKCDETKWKGWNKKNISETTLQKYEKLKSNRKKRRKVKSRARRCRKNEQLLIERADFALKENLVINLTNIEIPKFSIAVLSYGPGWIPHPKFDQEKFKIDTLNAANKQCWSALFKDRKENDQTTLPFELLKNEVTRSCTTLLDPAIRQVKDAMIDVANNVLPPKPKSNINRYEKEGLIWLEKAGKAGEISIT